MRSFLVPDGGDAATQQAYAQVIAIHAALLPTGKILYFGGDQHDPGTHHLGMVDEPPPGATSEEPEETEETPPETGPDQSESGTTR